MPVGQQAGEAEAEYGGWVLLPGGNGTSPGLRKWWALVRAMCFDAPTGHTEDVTARIAVRGLVSVGIAHPRTDHQLGPFCRCNLGGWDKDSTNLSQAQIP